MDELLFLDSLHDFGDKSRTDDVKEETPGQFRENMIRQLLIKLLKDLNWILKRDVDRVPKTNNFEMLKMFIDGMYNEETKNLNENLKLSKFQV